jgi:hypothetical protein
MMLALLLMSASAAILPSTVPARTFDLATIQSLKKCGSRSTNEIVVCDRTNPDRFRVRPIDGASRFDKSSSRAEAQIGEGTSITAETEAANVGGFKSNRLMARLKFKF